MLAVLLPVNPNSCTAVLPRGLQSRLVQKPYRCSAPELTQPAAELRRVLDEAPKGRRFRMRARIGERKRWYELPEEVG